MPSWPQLLAPLTQTSVLLQIVLLLITAGTVLHRAPGSQRLVLSTVALYGAGLLGLLLGNLAGAAGWMDVGGILRQASVLLLGIALIRLLGALLFRVGLPLLRFAPPSIIEDLVVFAAYVMWAMLRLSQVGLDLGSILTTSAVLTAILAFSLQDTLGNILGGTTLQLDNSLHVGDWVQIGDTVGRVVDIRWRSTLIETRNWETVVMPNAVLMKTAFSILGRRSGEPVRWRRWIRFSVSFDVPPQQVVQLVEQALRRARIPNVAGHPAPNCVVMGIDSSVVNYATRYWLTDLHNDDPTDSAVRLRIYAAFRRAGISFAFPQQTLHLIKEGEKREQRQRAREQERREAMLASVALFDSLSDAERAALAKNLVYAPFVAGETLTQQGDTAHWLYLLISGEVEIVLTAEDGSRHRVDTLRAGTDASIFGEMGLLTGAPRAASVVALEDVECYRLDKAGFEEILRRRPAIAEEVSGIMAERKADLAVAHEEILNVDRQQLLQDSRSELLRGIRRFFHLDEVRAGP